MSAFVKASTDSESRKRKAAHGERDPRESIWLGKNSSELRESDHLHESVNKLVIRNRATTISEQIGLAGADHLTASNVSPKPRNTMGLVHWLTLHPLVVLVLQYD
jgi:hypothetical protein